MKHVIEQWECPPLKAKLSRRQCAVNRRLVAEGQAAGADYDFVNSGERPQAVIRLRECLSCRGVVWWACKTGRGPVSISVAALREQHQKAADQRKRLAG